VPRRHASLIALAVGPRRLRARRGTAGAPYFPLDRNGGHDVADYALELDYEPATDTLTGTATVAPAPPRR